MVLRPTRFALIQPCHEGTTMSTVELTPSVDQVEPGLRAFDAIASL